MAAPRSDRDQATAIDALVRKLHTRRIINWQPEFRIGKPLYDALLDLLARGALTDHQTANALVVLHRLRGHGEDPVFVAILRTLTHESKRARDQAATLCLGMIRFSHRPLTESLRAKLRDALKLGVSKNVATAISQLLDRPYAP